METDPDVFVAKKLEVEVWGAFYIIVSGIRFGMSADKDNFKAYLARLKTVIPMVSDVLQFAIVLYRIIGQKYSMFVRIRLYGCDY